MSDSLVSLLTLRVALAGFSFPGLRFVLALVRVPTLDCSSGKYSLRHRRQNCSARQAACFHCLRPTKSALSVAGSLLRRITQLRCRRWLGAGPEEFVNL